MRKEKKAKKLREKTPKEVKEACQRKKREGGGRQTFPGTVLAKMFDSDAERPPAIKVCKLLVIHSTTFHLK